MKRYEGLFILEPAMSGDKLKEVISSIEELIKQFKGSVEKIDDWGNRKLQYPINGKKEAQWRLVYFSSPPGNIVELRKIWRMKEGILRFSIFKNEGEKNGKSE